MSELDVSKLDDKLKEIEAKFNKAVQMAAQGRDEQIRLRGEFDAISRLKAELDPPENKKEDAADAASGGTVGK